MENVTIKKTMVDALAFVTENGNMSKENLAKFTTLFCVPKTAVSSGGPKEVTILRDAEDNILGRKCMITNKFFVIDRFAKNTSCIKEADGAKGKLYNESKKIEKEANSILEDARQLTDVQEKVNKFEEYDAEMLRAAEVRTTPIEVDAEWLDGSFDTIEDLAADLGAVYPLPVEETEA